MAKSKMRISNLAHFLIVAAFVSFAKLGSVSTTTTTETENTFHWTNKVELSPNITLQWDTTDTEYFTAEVISNVEGYVGIGFSPNGGMAGSDIIMCWVEESGTVQLKDYFARLNGAPVEDENQDVILINGKETENGTSCMFKRKWDTCDFKEDIPITENTIKLIWAVSDRDPERCVLQWHGNINRGVKSVSMRQEVASSFRVPEVGGKHWDVQLLNHQVTEERTQFHCKMFRFPKLTRRHHIVGYLPIIAPEHKKFVHHITLLRCNLPSNVNKTADEVFEKFLNHTGSKCYTKEVPQEWLMYCKTFEVALTSSMEGEILPDHIGKSISEEENRSESVYFVLEVHYENTDELPFEDSSGIRVLYNENIRQFESSILFLGQRVTPFMLIPPKQEKFRIKGFCSGHCTRNGFPKEGVLAFSILLHGHIFAKSIILRHVRNGAELPPLAQDKFYDFNYQQYKKLSHEVRILPGDDLIVECEYDNPTDNFILGGLSSSREMCQALVLYYPKAFLVDCRSQYEFHSFFDRLGIYENIKGDILQKLHLPYDPSDVEGGKNVSIFDDSLVLYSITGAEDWNHTLFDDLFIQRQSQNVNASENRLSVMGVLKNNICFDTPKDSIDKKWSEDKHYMHCGAVGGRRIDSEKYIQYIPYYTPYEPAPVCKGKELVSGSSKSGYGPAHSFKLEVGPRKIGTGNEAGTGAEGTAINFFLFISTLVLNVCRCEFGKYIPT